MTGDLARMTAEIVAFRDERDWKQFHNPKDMALSLLLEASELAEIFQWKNGAEIAAAVEEKKTALGHELADVLYWVLLLAHDTGIDLPTAFQNKLGLNREKYPAEKFRGSSKKYSEAS